MKLVEIKDADFLRMDRDVQPEPALNQLDQSQVLVDRTQHPPFLHPTPPFFNFFFFFSFPWQKKIKKGVQGVKREDAVSCPQAPVGPITFGPAPPTFKAGLSIAKFRKTKYLICIQTYRKQCNSSSYCISEKCNVPDGIDPGICHCSNN